MAKQLFSLCQTLFVHYLNDLSFRSSFSRKTSQYLPMARTRRLINITVCSNWPTLPARLTLPISQDVNKRGFYWMFNSPTVHAAGMKLRKSKHLSLHKKELTQQICSNNYLPARNSPTTFQHVLYVNHGYDIFAY